jgi:hypothetical protein
MTNVLVYKRTGFYSTSCCFSSVEQLISSTKYNVTLLLSSLSLRKLKYIPFPDAKNNLKLAPGFEERLVGKPQNKPSWIPNTVDRKSTECMIKDRTPTG